MLDSISREKKDSFESNTNNKSTDMCFEYKGTHLKFIPYEFINDRVLFCCIAVNFEERMKKNIRFNVFEIESEHADIHMKRSSDRSFHWRTHDFNVHPCSTDLNRINRFVRCEY